MGNWDSEMSNAKEIPKSTLGRNMISGLLGSPCSWEAVREAEKGPSACAFVFLPLSLLSHPLQDPLISCNIPPVRPPWFSFPAHPVLTKLPQKPSHILILFGTGNHRPGADFVQNLEGEGRPNELENPHPFFPPRTPTALSLRPPSPSQD